MKSALPETRDIDELLRFLPKLYSPVFKPIERWGGGTKNAQGIYTMPWPVYNETVEAFFRACSKECWTDFAYQPDIASEMLKSASAISSASLAQIKTMLTFCVRGERFCDGHWGAMIEEGRIRRLLNRLQEIREQ